MSIVKNPKLSVSLLAASIGATLAFPSLALAQEASASPDVQQARSAQKKDKSATTLDGVTVTAQRRVQLAKDVPVTVTAVSAQQLKESGVKSIFDLTSAVSGLSWGGAGNLTQPSIRGVSSTVSVGGAENANSLYVDGVFYALPHLFGSNLPDVERVEVLKGPQGTLFGRNSVGGAIRIFTRNPTNYTTGSFSVDYGGYTGDEGSRSSPHTVIKGFFSTPIVDDLLSFSISAAHDYTPGWMTDDRTGDRYAPVKRDNARVKLLFTPNDNLSVMLNAYYLKHDDRGLQAMTPIDGLVVATQYPGSVVATQPYHTGFDVTDNVGDWDNADVKSKGVSAQVEWTTDAGVFTSTTNTNKDNVYNRTSIQQSYGSLACLQVFACLHLDRGYDYKAVSQEFNFSSRDFGNFNFTTGLFYYHSQQNGFQYVNGDVNPALPQGLLSYIQQLNLTSTAIYGEVQYKATDKLTAIVGGRYTQEKRHDTQSAPTALDRREDFNSFLPRVSLEYKLTQATNAYATWSVGYQSGLTGISNTGSVPPYSPVQPEKNYAYEIGIKHATAKASFDVAAFYYDYKNKQEQVSVLQAGTTATYAVFHVNTGPVRIYGLDMDATYMLNDDFTVRGNLSWVPEAEYLDFPNAVGISTTRTANGQFAQVFFDATGYRLMRSPKVTANLTLAYNHDLAHGSVDASATATHSTKVYHDTYHVIEEPGYTTLSARVGYTFNNSHLRLGVYGRNLTNAVYIFHGFASAAGFTANYAAPRELGVSVNYDF